MMNDDVIGMLDACRLAEKEQALFYRTLAAEAEERGDAALSERLQLLHADEQHHLSRLKARLLELGRGAADPVTPRPAVPDLDAWEDVARAREHDEVRRYEQLLRQPLDEATAALAGTILEVERAHARELGGKWTMA
jgi:rubrerythrin